MNSTTVEGQRVQIGDWVSFKSDIEQSGRIVAIRHGRLGGMDLELENPNGFSGDYIGGQDRTVQRAGDCWVE
jgi:hypothetical protein